MQSDDPRADPAIVDLIELAGLWLAAEDSPSLVRTLRRLDEALAERFPSELEFAERFRQLLALVDEAQLGRVEMNQVRRQYRRATLG